MRRGVEKGLRSLTLAALTCWSVTAHAQQAADAVAPEAESDLSVLWPNASEDILASLRAKANGLPVEAQDWMIAAANPLAVQAGAKILQNGGTAADAIVAVQAVLGLVEPQSSGLGGGAFLLWYDAKTGKLTTLDGRETAPLALTPRLFQTDAGEPLKFFDAVVGGLSVGTPGTPALLAEAQRRWGKRPWVGLFGDAIRLAEDGFPVSPRLASLVARDHDRLARFEETAAYFLPAGAPLEAGQVLRNPAYAETLRTISDQGVGVFYSGDIAADIATSVQTAPGNPGKLAPLDLAIYRVVERDPVCVSYRGHDVCGMGPPSSGGLAVGQILGLLRHSDLSGLGPESPESWRLIGDASRLAFADRGRYVADNDFLPVPVKGMLDDGYLIDRNKLLGGDDALPEVAPGTPAFDHALNWADDDAIEFPSTSHISIVDGYGNALSMTTTIENAFGSRLMVRGFLLNNELTDFSFRTHRDGRPIANAVAPGKRPRSSMAPTIVLKDGKPVLVIGSPGGSRIIGYVAQAIIAHLDWGMDVQQAVAMRHLVNRFGTYDVEDGITASLTTSLEQMGYDVKLGTLNSGLHAIAIGTNLQGGADPRREGIALGR
ncbi:Gamma-glutamyltranspeptidase precursor [Thalassovita gelatinovora]|uniref:Glutathione hydrolase proenzyme n=1 Tax=Thalassovita gelatinovora TaxID=53501 RepID=A0A0P1F6M0_THAGE|nr:gamma-glutamyltransferase [Thalassovita gelatinovora]QIZ79153.1 gamma-glutamyltransferase [Thalassovita gelatinovora]CUH63601.1 Gamma-glutamyltranspeptidase precursor [Thalassovita gelatinovora]SER00359.1 gamma-glutamyltranspeptidase / glutathione hydrolase [Thalassovita gelatinovora]